MSGTRIRFEARKSIFGSSVQGDLFRVCLDVAVEILILGCMLGFRDMFVKKMKEWQEQRWKFWMICFHTSELVQ